MQIDTYVSETHPTTYLSVPAGKPLTEIALSAPAAKHAWVLQKRNYELRDGLIAIGRREAEAIEADGFVMHGAAVTFTETIA